MITIKFEYTPGDKFATFNRQRTVSGITSMYMALKIITDDRERTTKEGEEPIRITLENPDQPYQFDGR